MTDGPLSDLTVIDFTQFRAGPWCTQLMGVMGAEVVKIERPGSGASERHTEPTVEGMSVEHLARNRNKQSLSVDLKTDSGQTIARDLIRDADIVVENFSPGTIERLGLGYERMSEENPEVIYASIKGYGETGPYSDRKGVDLIMQAEGGIMSVTGPEGGQPVKVGQAIGDIGAGLYATIGVLAALHERDETGTGQKISTDLFGTIISFMEEYLTRYGATGENPTPYGRRHQTTIPYEVAETADGYIAFLPTGGDEGWELFCEEIINDEQMLKYDTLEKRQEHYEEIADAMHPILKEEPTEYWMDTFSKYDFPHGPLNKVSDVVDHPQAQAQGYVFNYEHEHAGEVLLHGHPLHFSENDTRLDFGSPKLGEHTDDVLQQLGFDEDEINTLHEDNVVE